ncbi:hypothetical protein ACFSTD_22340 [Novosphingobium colocasiae]
MNVAKLHTQSASVFGQVEYKITPHHLCHRRPARHRRQAEFLLRCLCLYQCRSLRDQH